MGDSPLSDTASDTAAQMTAVATPESVTSESR